MWLSDFVTFVYRRNEFKGTNYEIFSTPLTLILPDLTLPTFEEKRVHYRMFYWSWY